MQFGNLLNRFGKANDPQELLLALVIGPEAVGSAIWQKDATQPHILRLGSVEEWSKDEELLTAADASVSTALEGIEHEPNEVVLGIPESWAEGDSIAGNKKAIIKELSEKLSLKPVGFVVTTEAIINFLKSKEGTPPTAIILHLSAEEVVVSLVKLGQIVGSHTVGRSDDLGSDVEEGLARFEKKEPFPSRMILFDGHLDLESDRQTLLSYAWQEKLAFLHIPKIEILESDIPVRAVVVAAAAETMAKTVAQEEASDNQTNLETHGFYAEQDVLEKKPPTPPPDSLPPPPEPKTLEPDVPSPPGKLPSPSFLSQAKVHLTNFFAAISGRLSGPPMGGRKLNPLLAVWLGGFILVSLLLTVAYWRFPKATVTLYLIPKKVEVDVDFTIVSGESSDLNENSLHGERVEVEVEGQKETNTSGETLVGDKAKGTVDVFNKTNSLKKFSAGTVLIGPSGIEYELDANIEVASQSATDTGITFGKTSVDVTAVAVGSDANVSQGALFEVDGFGASTYSAKATSNFAGGSSRQVKSVAAADEEKLEEELTTELTQKALDELKSQKASEEVIIDAEYEVEAVDKKFSATVGEEADTLSLNLKLRLTTFKVKTAEILLLAQKSEEQVTTGYTPVASASDITVTSADLGEDGGDVSITLATKLIPQIDESALKNHLKGKYPQDLESFLKTIPNFARVDIELTPRLPQVLATFPHVAENITLSIAAEDN